MTVESEHSDNFFRSETDKASVWVMRYAPGVSVEALSDRSRLDFNYTVSWFEHFGHRDGLDVSSQDYLGHDLSLFAAEKIYTRLLAGIKEEFLLTREPGATDNYSQIVTRDKYWRNRVSPFISYDIAEKGEIKFAYRNEELEYENAPTRPNSTENRGIATATYNLNTTNHIDLDGQIWHRDYTSGTESDYDSYQMQVIYRREFSSWLSGQASAGYQWRTFDKPTVPSFESPVASIGVVGATERTKFNLSFEYGVVDFTIGDAYFNAYRLNAFGQRICWDVLRAYAGGYWQRSVYEDSTRQDDTYNIYAGLGYTFLHKILELSLEYNWTNRDSNNPLFNYTENIIFIRLTAKYGLPRKE